MARTGALSAPCSGSDSPPEFRESRRTSAACSCWRSSDRSRRAPRRRRRSPYATLSCSRITWTSIGLMGASAALAGQNLGAGKPDRAAAAVHVAARIGLSSAVIVGALFLFFPRQLLVVFGMHDPVV